MAFKKTKKSSTKKFSKKPRSTRAPKRMFSKAKSLNPYTQNKGISVEAYSESDIFAGTTNFFGQSYQGGTVPSGQTYTPLSLAMTNRSATLSSAFKWYRMTEVEIIFYPNYDTFQETVTGGTSVPYLFIYMDRDGTQQPLSQSDYEELGCKPIKFTKVIKKKFKPNTLMQAYLSVAGGIAQVVPSLDYDRWLPTTAMESANPYDPHQVPYFGLAMGCFQETSNAASIGRIEILVKFEFNEPQVQTGL